MDDETIEEALAAIKAKHADMVSQLGAPLEWAIVEVMGHRRYIGQLLEVTLAGAPMLRVHVPEVRIEGLEHDWQPGPEGREHRVVRDVVDTWAPYAVDLGGAALFAVTRCSEERARAELPASHRGPAGVRTVGEWRPLHDPHMLPGPVVEAEEVLDPWADADRVEE